MNFFELVEAAGLRALGLTLSTIFCFHNKLHNLCSSDHSRHVRLYESLRVRNKDRSHFARQQILSILGVIIFSGLAAYDTQNIKNTLMDNDEDLVKKEILGALNLYLDFVNLFLDLIKLLGKRR